MVANAKNDLSLHGLNLPLSRTTSQMIARGVRQCSKIADNATRGPDARWSSNAGRSQSGTLHGCLIISLCSEGPSFAKGR